MLSTNISQSHLLYGCHGEIEQSISRSETTLMGVVMMLIIIVSLFGNSLVMVTIYKFRRMRTITNMLLCSLAFCDLLSPLFRVTFIGVSSLRRRWLFGCSWCTVSSQIGIFFSAASIAHLCIITLERYVSIIHPYKHQGWVTRRRIIIMISCVWGLSVVLALLPFIFRDKIELRFNVHVPTCEVHLVKHPYLAVIMAAAYFALPFLIMIIAYYHIFQAAVVQTKKMSQYSVGNREEKQKRQVKQEWKTVKTVVVVVGVFFVLWLPYFLITVVKAFRVALPYWVSRFTVTFVYINTCCNWIVFSVRNRKLRACFLKLLRLKKKVDIFSTFKNSITRDQQRAPRGRKHSKTRDHSHAQTNHAFEESIVKKQDQQVKFADQNPTPNDLTFENEGTGTENKRPFVESNCSILKNSPLRGDANSDTSTKQTTYTSGEKDSSNSDTSKTKTTNISGEKDLFDSDTSNTQTTSTSGGKDLSNRDTSKTKTTNISGEKDLFESDTSKTQTTCTSGEKDLSKRDTSDEPTFESDSSNITSDKQEQFSKSDANSTSNEPTNNYTPKEQPSDGHSPNTSFRFKDHSFTNNNTLEEHSRELNTSKGGQVD